MSRVYFLNNDQKQTGAIAVKAICVISAIGPFSSISETALLKGGI
ncbi:hypothetical protein [Sporosarcina sp. P12(2017)]|nr:hypothetical protein [Sporosarcina sp. P12(2017)]